MPPDPEEVVHFANESDKNELEIVVRLDVARPEDRYYEDAGGFQVPHPIDGRRQYGVMFVFDSGATHTKLSAGLAVALGLDLSGGEVPVMTASGDLVARQSFLRIAIGKDWVKLPCIVECGIDGLAKDKLDENLLGLAGILDRYKVTISAEGLELQKRQ